ncbi:MAG TPA: hypothetical protein PK121_00840 [Candidatus Pacearchaeota archaeon]|nr:hypothetical protein [Candidatus Pacearchaeota archaeon]
MKKRKKIKIFEKSSFSFVKIFFLLLIFISLPFVVKSQYPWYPQIDISTPPSDYNYSNNPAFPSNPSGLGVVDTLIRLPIAFVAMLVSFIGKLGVMLADTASSLVTFILSPDFIKYSYTNPQNNPLIKAGLGITQGLSNMVLVLALIVIALSTIIGFKEYEARKLLPIFIVVALLVNFSPVICGLIVDAANIVMNFFTDEVIGGTNLTNKIKDEIDKYSFKDYFQYSELPFDQLFKIITVTTVAFIFAGTLVLYSVVFILRYLFIWILVILSPLAFVAYILPYTRKYWSLWWENLIQWQVIGITGTFFLYLSDLFTDTMTEIKSSDVGSLSGTILALTFPAIFAVISFVLAVKLSAMGSKSIIGGTSRFIKGVGKETAWQGYKGVKRAPGATVRGISGAVSGTISAGRNFSTQYSMLRTGVAGRPPATRLQALGGAISGWAQRTGTAIKNYNWPVSKGVFRAVVDIGKRGIKESGLYKPEKKKE